MNFLHQSLYRAYRPKTFDEVIGQEPITTTLKNEVIKQQFAHAYLLTGSRGTGKTTCARIIAKARNCNGVVDGNPCNACVFCKGIDNGSLLDVIEIDAASNTGVDTIRELRAEAMMLPTSASHRIYIIDEAHMLSTGASNALLKIIEEPPKHVVFILATTETHKILPTIFSRCQSFHFRRIKSEVIAQALIEIAKKEEISLTLEPALLIAKLSDGGMRDALSTLELCAAYTKEITMQTVMNISGMIPDGFLFELSSAVLEQNIAKALQVVQTLSQNSMNYDTICNQLIAHYRNLMIAKATTNTGDLIVCLPEELERYHQVASQYAMPKILHILDVLQVTTAKISKTTARRSELEMALIKLCSDVCSNTQDTQKLLLRIEKLELALKSGTAPVQHKVPLSVAPQPTAPISLKEVVPFELWQEVLEKIANKNPALFGALDHSKAYTTANIILIDAKDELFSTFIRENEYAKNTLRETVEQVTGKVYRLGPYKPDNYKVVEKESDKIQELLEKATQAGVDVTIK